MIPLNTPPGTKIVCIRVGVPACAHMPPSPLKIGETYTLDSWSPCPPGAIELVEFPTDDEYDLVTFDRSLFRLPVTPESLLAQPSRAPDDLDRRQAPTPERQLVGAATSDSGGSAPLPPEGRAKATPTPHPSPQGGGERGGGAS